MGSYERKAVFTRIPGTAPFHLLSPADLRVGTKLGTVVSLRIYVHATFAGALYGSTQALSRHRSNC
jgi:hypothetical protein